MIKDKRILVVDDDEFSLELLKNALSSAGYETHLCHNGQEALEILQTQSFDAVITDIVMPEKDGVQLVNDMRAINVQIPVIAISGDKQGQKADENLDFACYFADEVLKKPIKKDDLLKTLEILLAPSARSAMLNL